MKPKLASLFKGKDTAAEEKNEARAVRSGKVSPAQYARAEKAEGTPGSKAALVAKGKAMKSGKLSPAQYAKQEAKGK